MCEVNQNGYIPTEDYRLYVYVFTNGYIYRFPLYISTCKWLIFRLNGIFSILRREKNILWIFYVNNIIEGFLLIYIHVYMYLSIHNIWIRVTAKSFSLNNFDSMGRAAPQFFSYNSNTIVIHYLKNKIFSILFCFAWLFLFISLKYE